MHNGWAHFLNRRMVAGKPAQFVCEHESLLPLIPKGALCEVERFDKKSLQVHEIVLCRTGGVYRLGLVIFVKGNRVTVSEGTGYAKWEIPMHQIFGRLKILELTNVCMGS